MKAKWVVSLIMALVTVVALFTNPTPERHKEAVKNKIHQYLKNQMIEDYSNSENSYSSVAHAFELLIENTIVDNLLDNFVGSDNYLIFSITKINVEDKSKAIGYGVFGNVILFKELDETLKEAVENFEKSEKSGGKKPASRKKG